MNRKLNNLLYDPASITMQTYKQEFFLSDLIYDLYLFFTTKIYEFLDDIVAKFIIDELVEMRGDRLKYLILEILVGCF